MTVAATRTGFDFGRAFQQTFGLLSRNIGVYSLIALVLVGLPNAVFGVIWPSALGDGGLTPDYWARLAVLTLLSFVVSAMMQAAIIQGAVADSNGRRANLAECLTASIKHAGPVIAVSVLLGLAVMAGFILLVIPGLVVSLMFSVAVPAQVVERTGVIGAFRRSRQLTQNSLGPIFGLNFVIGLIVAAISFAIGAVGGGIIAAFALSKLALLNSAIVAPLASVVTGLITACSVSAIYFELRRVRDGVGVSDLASIFD